MGIFAQGPEDAASWLQLFDRFGVSLVMLALFIFGSGYMLKRLVGKGGILTQYATAVGAAHGKTADAVEVMAENGERVAIQLTTMEKRLEGVENTASSMDTQLQDSHSKFATIGLTRCARHTCDILEHLAAKLDIPDKVAPSLAVMRSELDEHLREAGNGD